MALKPVRTINIWFPLFKGAKTSTDDLHYDQDAQYQYYRHGPLARTEIGRRQVQGLDYAYTLQGWMKIVNSSSMDTLHDMGADGLTTAGNSQFAVDIYGFSLGYFTGDYFNIDVSKKPELNYSGYGFSTTCNSLYNGNIRQAVYGMNKMNDSAIGYNYQYDQLNRLVGMQPYIRPDLTNWNWSPGVTTTSYKEAISYDPNGNIKTYNRNVDPTAPGYYTDVMDDMTYHYYTNTNRLSYVDDAIPAAWCPDDIDDQSSGNYQYDKIGNLVYDNQDTAKYLWLNNGKLDSIHKTRVAIKFHYDPMGNRVNKSVFDLVKNTVEETFYIRDAQGNVLSTYTRNDHDSLWLDEQHIYGSSRLGLINTKLLYFTNAGGNLARAYDHSKVAEGNKQYELTNHLGNVLSTISDKKFAVDVGSNGSIDYFSPAVLSQNDYYPGGMLMPGRTFNSTTYNFGFNGQEKINEFHGIEGSILSFEFREYDTRIGRFFCVDPISGKYPELTPYQFAGNKPIWGREFEGLETWYTTTDSDNPVSNWGNDNGSGYVNSGQAGPRSDNYAQENSVVNGSEQTTNLTIGIKHGRTVQGADGKHSALPGTGGKLGGHVMAIFGENAYGFTNEFGNQMGNHIFGKSGTEQNGHFDKQPSSVLTTDNGERSVSLFSKQVTLDQYFAAESFYSGWANKFYADENNNSFSGPYAPYDYSVFSLGGGQRCASSLLKTMVQFDIIKSRGVMSDHLHAINPGSLIKYLKSKGGIANGFSYTPNPPKDSSTDKIWNK